MNTPSDVTVKGGPSNYLKSLYFPRDFFRRGLGCLQPIFSVLSQFIILFSFALKARFLTSVKISCTPAIYLLQADNSQILGKFVSIQKAMVNIILSAKVPVGDACHAAKDLC